MPWFSINIARGFLLQSTGVSNFGYVIRVLNFMIVPFSVDLDKVCLGGHFFCFDCLLIFAICIFNDDMSD